MVVNKSSGTLGPILTTSESVISDVVIGIYFHVVAQKGLDAYIDSSKMQCCMP